MLNVDLQNKRPRVRGVATRLDALKTLLIALAVSVSLALLVVIFISLMQPSPQIDRPEVAPLIGRVTETVATPVSFSDTIGRDIRVSYENMRQFERINYEVHFAQNLFTNLLILVPDGIDFTSLKILDYRRVLAEGNSTNRASLARFFENIMEDDDWLLEPRPSSRIYSRGDFYGFTVEATYTIPPRVLSRMVVDEREFPTLNQLPYIKDQISRSARMAGITLSGDLTTLHSDVGGRYKRYLYSVGGAGTFTEFVRFIKIVYSTGLPISFQDIDLSAYGRGVNFSLQIAVVVE